MDQLPEHLKVMLRNPKLTMNQKLLTLMMFGPKRMMPQAETQWYDENLKIGTKIRRLISEGKVCIDGFDSAFKILARAPVGLEE